MGVVNWTGAWNPRPGPLHRIGPAPQPGAGAGHALHRRAQLDPGLPSRRRGGARHLRGDLRSHRGCGWRTLGSARRLGERLYRREDRRRDLPRLHRDLAASLSRSLWSNGPGPRARLAASSVRAGLLHQRAEPEGRALLPRLPASIRRPRRAEQGGRPVLPRRHLQPQRHALESVRRMVLGSDQRRPDAQRTVRALVQPLRGRPVRRPRREARAVQRR